MAWTHIQSVQNSSAGTTSLATTIAATARGNLVVVNVKIGSTGVTPTSVVDDKGNTYIKELGPINSTDSTFEMLQYYAIQNVGGATIVTVNLSSHSIRVMIEEYNPNDLTKLIVFDKSSSGTDAGVANQSSAVSSFSPSFSGELITAGVGFGSTNTWVAGTNYVLGSTNASGATEYRLSGTTTETAPMTWINNSRWVEVAGAFNLITPPSGGLLLMGLGD